MIAFRSAVTALAGLFITLITMLFTASVTFGQLPPPDRTGGVIPPPPPAPETVVSYGSPIWVFVVVAATAVLVTAAAILGARLLRHPPQPGDAPA